MNKLEINKKELRKFLTIYHGLYSHNNLDGKKGVLEVFKKIGSIQYDPLDVVGKNHDLVLQARIKNYRPNLITELLYKDRELIDGWDKMMSIYLSAEWPNFYRLREVRGYQVEDILKYRKSSEALNYIEEVKVYISKNGATSPSQIKLGELKKGRWGHKNISSATMDYLWNIGILGLESKQNIQKKYDLIENILPKNILKLKDPFKSDSEFYKWYIKRRIGSIRIYWSKSGSGWLGKFLSDKKIRDKILKELLDEKELSLVKVKDMKEDFYVRTKDIKILNSIDSINNKKVSFLAPLDNLLWDRKFIKQVFDFEYIWEVYKPITERKYGYYVIPVIYGDTFIGRFEPEKIEKNSLFSIKKWWWEENIVITAELIKEIEKSLYQFISYLGIKKIDNKVMKKIKKECGCNE